ncbi:phytanoyl-CoA dioxygenase family protein [Microcoleus sp. bin38.metabat.b11b12b14.051]|uniref:phytanoyl-CoA dioxygenase family protein n=1 Tax=Microcoleus sp. bin38.metabat.b11b12b14.051 TaxID=2742709 RepID=UPI0025E99548|nr:phytanoyl-CoA dioxygenase family protein [Microcoleus sp. bin38.metabat.b11b12b14.051]
MNNILIQKSEKFWYKLANYFLRNYRCLIQDPRLFLMGKFARFEIVRDWAAMLLKHPTQSPEISQEHPSILGELDVCAIASTIERDSCYQGLQLPEGVVQELVKFASSTVGYINRDTQRPWRCTGTEQVRVDLPKNARVCSYMSNGKLSSTLKKLEKDPGILAVAAKFLGAEPVHLGSEISWSFPVPAENHVQQRQAAQVFHYDLDDYRFIKFFFYLTDVDMSSGPHTYVSGSHKGKKLLHQVIGTRCADIDDEKLVELYGEQNVVNICGKAGFGFVENPLCFHRGTQPTEKPRLMLQIEYTVNDYGNIHEALGY